MSKIRNLKISLLLGIMCMFLTLGIAIQINTVKNSTTTVGKTLVEYELRDSTLRWKQRYEEAYAELEDKEEELNSLREQVASKDESYGGLTNKLEQYNLLLGNTELIGKGIIITLKDGDSDKVKGYATDYIVQYAPCQPAEALNSFYPYSLQLLFTGYTRHTFPVPRPEP